MEDEKSEKMKTSKPEDFDSSKTESFGSARNPQESEILDGSQSSKTLKSEEFRHHQNSKKNFEIFDLYDLSEVKVEDVALKRVINLTPKLILKSHGRSIEKFGQIKVNVVERLINLLGVPGHRGKRHKLIKSYGSGKYSKNTRIVLKAFKIIEEKKKANPVQVFVKAVENASPKDEITVIEYGGARYPQAVDVSPLRRVNLALRNIVHGASDKAFNKKATIAEALANEIILASEANGESFAYQKKNEAEKQADSAR